MFYYLEIKNFIFFKFTLTRILNNKELANTGFNNSESDRKVDIADDDYIFISHKAVYLVF